jgi:predicted TIM-barrel fold metal-dependent hydrolase
MQHDIQRRQFLADAATWAGVAAAGASCVAANRILEAAQSKDEAAPGGHEPIVDPHQHLWDLEKLKLSWLSNPAMASLNRSFVTPDYLEATKGLNVVKAVYMEVDCDVDYQEREAEYALGLCQRGDSPTVGAVIGGRPASSGFGKYLEKFSGSPHLKGVRQILHVDSAPKGTCLEPRFVEGIKLLGERGLRFELCMRPGEIIDGVKLVDQCPKTRFVVDHCGNMSVQSTDRQLREVWMNGMREMAGHDHVVCKISGIVVTADRDRWKASDLAPNVDFCMDTFGENRVMFAGDWPVCTLVASYRQWVEALDSIVSRRTERFRRKLFHDNAAKFYELG